MNKKEKTGGKSGRSKKKKKAGALTWVGRVAATIGITLALIIVWLYGVMAVLVYGPSKTAKNQFVLSVQETSAIGFLANIFCSQEEIDAIKAANSIKDTDEVTDTSLVSIDTEDNSEVPDIEIIDVKGSTYSGKLMKIKDPSRLFVGTIEGFHQGNGQVVADIAKRYDAVGGVNGGEFVDGVVSYTHLTLPTTPYV